ncbi:MAG: Mur ligase family protein [Microthrixaceae bacterium]
MQILGLSEFDLAAAWDQRALLAVTGTNGKTTVAMLTEAMLERCGIATEAVGNLDVPLVNAIDDPRPSCFVVEASSFRLRAAPTFTARARG